MVDLIQLDSYPVQVTLKLLLQDKSTKKNIIWATDSYASFGEAYIDKSQMTENQLININTRIIQPRIFKDIGQQVYRTRKSAEVFTPAWICNKMNNFCDEEWFGYENVFNYQIEQEWIPIRDVIRFPEEMNKNWRTYVDSRRLEITCGEAPYLVSRYDTSTGVPIEIHKRIGILDRKIRVINENTVNEKEWMEWVIRAFQSVYGYEYQGDNLLIARINLLMTFIDYLKDRWGRQPNKSELYKIANIISWNIWQMDGLKGTVPVGILREEYHQMSLFESIEEVEENELEVLCKIYDWRKRKSVLYVELGKGRQDRMKFDFVIGNPPYQEETSNEITTNGQKSRKNIFHYFQIEADKIARDGTVMIYPGGRWIHQSGKGLKQFGMEQINDKRMSKLCFYPDSKEVFGNVVDLPDGVSIVVKNINKKTNKFKYIYSKNNVQQIVFTESPKDELLPLNPKDILIINKISSFVQSYSLDYLHKAILPRSLFGIESDFVSKNQEKVRRYKDGDFFDENVEIKAFTNDKAGSAGRSMWFVIDRNIIVKNTQYISEWQVVVSSAHPGGQEGRSNQISIIDNKSVFGRARVALRSFKTYEEAVNFYNYANTYFIKYAFLMTDESLASLGRKVPDLLDYTSNNTLIDFSRELDEQLFSLAKFSENDVEYVKGIIDNVE